MRLRLASAALLLAPVGVLAAPASVAAAPAAPSAPDVPAVREVVFRFGFDRAPDVVDGVAHYLSQGGFVGSVLTSSGGSVDRVQGASGGAALRFPGPCTGRSCPRALVEVPHDAALNPGDAAFSFGASVLLAPDETTPGSNLVQKGRFGTPGGQWKLQVDSPAGRPSCVFRSAGPSGVRLAKLESSLSVADGTWHDVSCVKRANRVAVVVDGHPTVLEARVGSVANTEPVRVGGPGLSPGDDQFHGALDDVFLRVVTVRSTSPE